MEVMGLMLGQFVDDYTITCVDVFAMPQVPYHRSTTMHTTGTLLTRPLLIAAWHRRVRGGRRPRLPDEHARHAEADGWFSPSLHHSLD